MTTCEELRERLDRCPLEVAESIQRLITQHGYSQGQLAKRIAIKRSTIANYLRLLGLPEPVRKGLREGKISMGHAKIILSVHNEVGQVSLYQAIIAHGYTVREADAWAREESARERVEADEAIHLKELQRRIQTTLGVRTEVKGKGVQGQVVLCYHDLDELDHILAKLGVTD